MILNKYDFKFATSPKDVGMKTGATIHTMNGLNMILRKVSPDEAIHASDWWEQQHLKRGMRSTGRAFPSEKEGFPPSIEHTTGTDNLMHRQ
jgi:hypothetical protein